MQNIRPIPASSAEPAAAVSLHGTARDHPTDKKRLVQDATNLGEDLEKSKS